jgi:catechol 2,3-dioxygenase-like lactoylglutathione lyase family enzyme
MIMPILTVNDVDASVAFFTDKLGFRHDMSMAGPQGGNIFAIVGLGAAVLGLGIDEAVPRNTPFAPGVQFMVYLPEELDIDRYYGDVKAKGVKIDDELADTYWGDRAFSIHDPNGYLLTFAVTIAQVPVEDMEAAIRKQDESKS